MRKTLVLVLLLLCGCGPVRDCSECDGDGKVYYGLDHPIVRMGFEVGEYDCPMCGGTGELE